ncbi:hypothetical protein B0I37DRAFT_406437 [Chaetomium sp. MPI-CAGE-AT-0009]|nr:hypothetical protein B0I37DRAFT_406437 [Chaetomium sp. MPI-CAGE-AT-0009]
MATVAPGGMPPPPPPGGNARQPPSDAPDPPDGETRQCRKCKRTLDMAQFVGKRGGSTANCSDCRGVAAAQKARSNTAVSMLARISGSIAEKSRIGRSMPARPSVQGFFDTPIAPRPESPAISPPGPAVPRLMASLQNLRRSEAPSPSPVRYPTVGVQAGHQVPNRKHHAHGLYNTSRERPPVRHLRLFAIPLAFFAVVNSRRIRQPPHPLDVNSLLLNVVIGYSAVKAWLHRLHPLSMS